MSKEKLASLFVFATFFFVGYGIVAFIRDIIAVIKWVI